MKINGTNQIMEDGGTSQEHPRSIAVTGKGGVGKTMLATLMIKILAQSGKRKILAIDADSSVSLPYALGMKTGKTVSDIRREMIDDPEVKRRIAEQHITTVMKSALVTENGLDLLVMGRPEEPGCFCGVNDLLRYGIDGMVKDYDITVIDGEAGPEQLNRRVLTSIDTLLVVADMSVRSLQTVKAIIDVASGHGRVNIQKTYLIINRFKGETASGSKAAQKMGLEVTGYIPEDENVSQYDGAGRPLLELPADSPSVMAVHQILKRVM